MFHTKTVFIVGAGASAELGLPAGSQLRTKIAQIVNIKFGDFGRTMSSGDHQVYQALQRLADESGSPESVNLYLHEGWNIAAAMPQALSIDNYIEAHNDNEKLVTCGKLAIARAIVEAEQKSMIYLDPRGDRKFNFSSVEDTWIAKFFQIATEGVAKKDIDDLFENVRIVSFNYDRCIRQYIRLALQNYYVLDDARANSVSAKLSIFYPYGTIGKLEWEDGQSRVRFGSDNLGRSLVDIGFGIKTFSERVDDVDYLSEVKYQIEKADRIVYLGYAFHGQNQNLLKLDRPTRCNEILATVYGVSKSDQQVINRSIRRQLGKDTHDLSVTLHEAKASQTFSDFWRTLAS